MRVVFIADVRSTIARGWISYFVGRGHDVHAISSYPCSPDIVPGAKIYQLPIAFSRLAETGRVTARPAGNSQSALSAAIAALRSGRLSNLSTSARCWLAPLELRLHVRRARELILQLSPDLVHAMRIPFEGMLAASATPGDIPLLTSVWGNDLTLFANRYQLIARETRRALQRTNALHCDCLRDLELASRTWGFDASKPALVSPSAGGIQPSIFYPAEPGSSLRRELNVTDDAPVVFNPRGFRGYVRNDVFFEAIPLMLRQHPTAVFVCAGMQSNPIADKWVRTFAIQESVRLLPPVSRERMADLFRLASVAISPSLHDGTPNTLLEAMACGCFPVAGDIESVHEWITDGDNGLLCDPTSPESLAGAIVRALDNEQMRNEAREQNLRLIADRAVYNNVMQQAEAFYSEIIQRKPVAQTGGFAR